MESMFKAVLWDMDGVLIDSMLHWKEFDYTFFREKHNYIITEDHIRYFTGKSDREVSAWIKEELKLKDSIEELTLERKIITDDIYTKKSAAMPGVRELVHEISLSSMKQAIASGASLDRIEITVDRFAWRDKFDSLLSVEHVDHLGKPAPDVYLYAAKQLGVKPENCVVIEDAENGVKSAKRAGMKCIAVLDPRWSFGNFDEADLIVGSLDDLEVKKFIGI